MNRKETRKLQRKYCDTLIKHRDFAKRYIPHLEPPSQIKLKEFIEGMTKFEKMIRGLNHNEFKRLHLSHMLPGNYITNIEKRYNVDVNNLLDRFNDKVNYLIEHDILFKRDTLIDDILDDKS